MIVVFTACDKQNTNSNQETDAATNNVSIPDEHFFTGEIISVEKGMILVSPDEENSAISPQVFVNISQFNDMTFEKGDRVRVIYNGQVAQSFPPQILGVISIIKE